MIRLKIGVACNLQTAPASKHRLLKLPANES